MVGGQGLESKTSSAAPAIRLSRSASDQRRLVEDPATDVLTNSAVGFISPSSRAPTRPRLRSPRLRVEGQHIGGAEQFVAAHVPRTCRLGQFRSEVGTPRDHVDPEGRADAGHPNVHASKSEHSEDSPCAAQLPADRRLPAAVADGRVLRHHVS